MTFDLQNDFFASLHLLFPYLANNILLHCRLIYTILYRNFEIWTYFRALPDAVGDTFAVIKFADNQEFSE